MGTIKILADVAFRDYDSIGVPVPGTEHKPLKTEILAVFTAIDTSLGGLLSNQVTGFVVFDTLAHLNGNLNYVANTGAGVYGDTTLNNGIYRKNGSSGSGSWTKLAPLQDAAALEIAFAAASAGALPVLKILTRTADPAGTIRATNDTSPVEYYTCRVGGAAVWTQSTVFDV
jgi:hypothetical protein